MANEIRLGNLARDTISGFEGVVVGRMEWLYRSSQIGLAPRELKDSKPIKTQWFDEMQCALVIP